MSAGFSKLLGCQNLGTYLKEGEQWGKFLRRLTFFFFWTCTNRLFIFFPLPKYMMRPKAQVVLIVPWNGKTLNKSLPKS